MAAVATTIFADRLAEAVERKRASSSSGSIPGRAVAGRARGEPSAAAPQRVRRFCSRDHRRGRAVRRRVKPQLAFFEALGADGIRAFEDVCAYARSAELIVIADAKRGDIGSTARAYAAAYLEPRDGAPPLADAMTVNPYLGRDSLEPFLARLPPRTAPASSASSRRRTPAARTCRTSCSPTAARLAAGRGARRTSWGEDLVGERGLSSVGAVVGATHPAGGRRGAAAAAAARSCSARRRRAGRDARPTSPARSRAGPRARSSASRARVIYAFRSSEDDWRAAAGAEAARLRARSGPSPAGSSDAEARRTPRAALWAPRRVPRRGDGRRAPGRAAALARPSLTRRRPTTVAATTAKPADDAAATARRPARSKRRVLRVRAGDTLERDRRAVQHDGGRAVDAQPRHRPDGARRSASASASASAQPRS